MKKALFIVIPIIAILAAAGGYTYYDYNSRIYLYAETEAGTEINADDFKKSDSVSAEIISVNGVSGSEVPTNAPGEINIVIKSGLFTYNTTLEVTDTIAPILEVSDLHIEAGTDCEASDFVTEASDNSDCTVSFKEEPDMTKYGKSTVTIVATDLAGNTTEKEAELVIQPVHSSLTVEAGDEMPEALDFLLPAVHETTAVSFRNLSEDMDTSHVGEISVMLDVDGRFYDSELIIEDTEAPTLLVNDLTGCTTSDFSPEAFVKSCEDNTNVTFSFESEPDYDKVGEQTVVIAATDEGNNKTTAEAKLTLSIDTEPPVIKGVHNITVLIGDSVSYKNGVSVTDNSGNNITLNVDSSEVSLQMPGTYNITYTATDKAGNTAEKTATVTVRAKSYDDATIDALAYGVLSRIINDSMSPMEKLNAIYSWIRGNVHYVNHSDKTNYNQGAYEGLHDHKGDCFVYAATANALLSRAGIQTQIIAKIPAATNHYWNLVDIGEGWHHFDTTPRHGGDFTCVYLTDAELMAYSTTHNNSHNYDRSVYYVP